MSGTQLAISCPRCSFSLNLAAASIVSGPISQTCPSCGLLFRVGRGLGEIFPSDPTFETEDGWYIRKDDGEVLYFPSLEILRRWAVEGHVSTGDEVSKRGKSWRPIFELPEFASLMVSQGTEQPQEKKGASWSRDMESVSEEMIEVEEFAPPPDRSRGIWMIVGFAFLLGLGIAYSLAQLDGESRDSVLVEEDVALVSETGVDIVESAPEESDASGSALAQATDVKASDSKDGGAATDDGSNTKVAEADAQDRDVVGTKEVPRTAVVRKERSSSPRKRKVKPVKSGEPNYDSLMEQGSQQLKSNPQLAVQTFMRALQFPEATSEARAKLGRSFLLVGDMQSAITHLEMARKRNAGYRPALWDLARAYQRLGNRKQAISVYQSLANLLDPDSQQAQQVKMELNRLGVSP